MAAPGPTAQAFLKFSRHGFSLWWAARAAEPQSHWASRDIGAPDQARSASLGTAGQPGLAAACWAPEPHSAWCLRGTSSLRSPERRLPPARPAPTVHSESGSLVRLGPETARQGPGLGRSGGWDETAAPVSAVGRPAMGVLPGRRSGQGAAVTSRHHSPWASAQVPPPLGASVLEALRTSPSSSVCLLPGILCLSLNRMHRRFPNSPRPTSRAACLSGPSPISPAGGSSPVKYKTAPSGPPQLCGAPPAQAAQQAGNLEPPWRPPASLTIPQSPAPVLSLPPARRA